MIIPPTEINNSTRVLVIDDHPAIATLLGDFISEMDGFRAVAVTYSGEKGLEALRVHGADLVILDLGLPGMNGLEVLAKIQADFPDVKVLIFSGLLNLETLRQAMRLGIAGYLEKTAPFDQLGMALQRVKDGQMVFGPEASVLLREVVRGGNSSAPIRSRETSILRLLAAGKQIKEIATEIGISLPGTYKAINVMRERMGARSIRDLIVVGARMEIAAAPSDNVE